MSVEAAAAGLRYALDEGPGLTRARTGRGFTYRDVQGRTIRDASQLARIRSLAIPPAWTDVWTSPVATGHIQATGRDAKGHKQYRYHPRWRTARDETKYQRLIAFARLLPQIRARVERDLAQAPAKRNVVRAIASVSLRFGNTVAVCRKCYVHPAVVDAYLDGSLVATLSARLSTESRRAGLPAEEARVLQLLARRLERSRVPVAA